MGKFKKNMELHTALGKLQIISTMANNVYRMAKEEIKNILRLYKDGVNVEHSCGGIPHTGFDFNDECQKNIVAMNYDEVNDRVIVYFENGTKSDNVAFDDIAYLMEELLDFFILEIE